MVISFNLWSHATDSEQYKAINKIISYLNLSAKVIDLATLAAGSFRLATLVPGNFSEFKCSLATVIPYKPLWNERLSIKKSTVPGQQNSVLCLATLFLT